MFLNKKQPESLTTQAGVLIKGIDKFVYTEEIITNIHSNDFIGLSICLKLL